MAYGVMIWMMCSVLFGPLFGALINTGMGDK